MKKILRRGWFLLFGVLCMTGCTKSGKLDEGNIACVIELETIPAEFDALNEDMQRQLDIEVYLCNEVKERTYSVHLNRENGFRQEAMLNPGFYQVRWCTESPYFLHITAKTRENVLEVGGDKSNYLGVYVSNPEELAANLLWMEPSEEILGLDPYSRRVQWKGQVIEIEEIGNYVDFEYDQPVRAYEQASFANMEERVGITVINETDHELPWQECAVQSVTFNSTNAVLPGGTMVGMPLGEMVHKENGSFGTPDSLEGSVLIGAGVDAIRAVYLDNSSGDKITVSTDLAAEHIIKITYEFEVYE